MIYAGYVKVALVKPQTGRVKFLKIGSFKFPPLRPKIVFKCATLSSDFACQMPLLKNRRRFLSSVKKLVYIRGTQRHGWKVILDAAYVIHGTLFELDIHIN